LVELNVNPAKPRQNHRDRNWAGAGPDDAQQHPKRDRIRKFVAQIAKLSPVRFAVAGSLGVSLIECGISLDKN